MRRRMCLPFLATLALMPALAPPARAETAQTPRLPNTAPPTVALADAALVDALTWGVNTTTMARFRAMGREPWLRAQLHPPPGDHLPPEARRQVAAIEASRKPVFDLIGEYDARGREANQTQDPDQKAAAQKAFQEGMSEIARQSAAASILRALYSDDQLRERMTWFWFNHFNVHAGKANLRLLVGDYEATIRAHALGDFRGLVMATLRHPAMLRYLDNADNAGGHVNENYARELMELHTMGVGSGYTQKDVEELARILTGAGIDARPEPPKLKPEWQRLLVRDGLFTFNPARHDLGDKTFLGARIPGSGWSEVEQAVDMLCAHPATARHVSRQLATYFVSDNPPQALVERMAETFSRSHGDIPAVLETMIRSPEFAATHGARFKDPARYVLSAIRLAYDDKVVLNTAPAQNWLNRLAEGLYNHQTPDGYPMHADAWNASGQMMTRFEIARQIGSGSSGLFRPPAPDQTDRPAFPLLQNRLWFESLQPTLSPRTRNALEQAISPQDWNTLFLSSPEFME